MSGTSGATPARGGPGQDEQAAALALAAVAGAVPQRPAPAARSGGSGATGTVSPMSDYGTDDMKEEEEEHHAHHGVGTAGRLASGSLSTRGASNAQPPGWGPGQQQQGQPGLGQQQQLAFGGSPGSGGAPDPAAAAAAAAAMQYQLMHMQHGSQGPGSDTQPSRGRRNARQQEQNKQAQQRYRAKRKAQFEELQRRVSELTSELAVAQRQRVENDSLRTEMAHLKAMLQAAAPGADLAAAGAAGAALLQPSEPKSSNTSLPDVPATHQQQQQQQQQQPAALQGGTMSPMAAAAHTNHLPPNNGSSGIFSGNNGGAFRPTPAARALAAATLAELPPGTAHGLLPLSSVGPGLSLGASAGALPASPLSPPQLPGKHVQAAMDLFYQELQAFAATAHLEHASVDGAGLSPEVCVKLTELVRTGIELIKMVLQTSGPDAAPLLTANLPSVGADGVSPADSLAQWRMVVARVQLAPEQHAALADWRRRFLQKIDDLYGRRLLHKAQLTQLPAGGAPPGQQPQWVEALLLQSAEATGFSACALAAAQLDGLVASLADNVREERSTACAMMAELLDRILTKVQAARFLLAGHPFCWNGLSFALAAASMASSQPAAPPAPAPALPQEQPLSELLSRLQAQAAGGAL